MNGPTAAARAPRGGPPGAPGHVTPGAPRLRQAIRVPDAAWALRPSWRSTSPGGNAAVFADTSRTPAGETGVVRVAVFVERWQHECCGDEFAVGDRVVWTLGVDGGWRHALLARHAPSRAVELDVVGVAGPDGAGRGGVLLSGDGVHAFLPDEPAPPLTDATDGRTTRSVVLFEEGHHGDVPEAVPPTSGVVTAVRLVRLAHRLDPAGRAHEPVAGSAALEDVRRAGRWQPDEVDGRTFVGFLVDLTVGP